MRNKLVITLLLSCLLATVFLSIFQHVSLEVYATATPHTVNSVYLGSSVATCFSFQEHAVYANGSYRVFYARPDDGYDQWYGYSNSTDGSSWSSLNPYSIPIAQSGQLSVFFDGTYIHRVRFDTTMYYCRGTPKADGSTSWGAEQTIGPGAYPCITVDSGGHVWIGYQNYTTDNYPFVIKNDYTNGTWKTASGFPFQLSTAYSVSWNVEPVALTGGKVYVVYCRQNYPAYGRLSSDGSTFGGQETISSYNIKGQNGAPYGYSFSASNIGDEVQFVYLRATTYQIRFNRRNSTAWKTTDELVQDSVTSTSVPAISIDTDLNLTYCLWAGSPTANHIYCNQRSGGAWSSPTDWIDESTDGLTSNVVLTCSHHQLVNSSIAVQYVTNNGSYFNVRFAILQPSSLNTAPTIGTFQAPSTVYANKYFFLNATVNDADGKTTLKNATIEINGTVILKWINSTSTFSEQSDANGYCTLDVSNSLRTSLNSTAYKLSWKIKLNWTYPEGSVNVVVTNTKVYDSQGASGSGSQTALFIFEDDLIVNSASVNDARANPSQSLTFTGQLTYQGTATAPEDTSGITAKVGLSGTVEGSTTTINSTGYFQIPFNAESTVANHTYTVYAVTDQNTVQNKTVYVVVDRGVITISANTTSPAPNAYVNFTVTAIYDFDDTSITSWTFNILKNSTHFASANFTDGGYADLFYVYTAENMTETTYGLTNFTSTPLTVYWSTYVALTIQTKDLDGNILTEAIVYFNTTQITVDSNGLATKTGLVKNHNVTVKVEWHGIKVNGTWTTNMTTTKTIEAPCQVWQLTFNAKDSDGVMLASSNTTLAWTSPNGTLNSLERPDGSWTFKVMNGTHYYRVGFHGVWITANTTVAMVNKNVTIINCNTDAVAYVLNAARYHWASNATWTAQSWNSTSLKLLIQFSDSASNYTLIADGPRPTYLLNVTFNMPVDYTTYLSLAHYGNRTITLSYESWGDFYIRSAQHRLSNVYWTEQKLTILIEGISGQNGTLTVYCGSRAGPREATGLANPTYNADTKILTGTYTFSSTVTVTLDWTTTTGGTTSGTTSGKLDLTIEDVRLSLVKGATQTFDLTISWSGINDITITRVTITEEYVLWFSLTETLPKQASKGSETEGTMTIQMKISVPWQITLGQSTIAVTVSASQDGGITVEKSGVIYLTVLSGAPSVTGIPEIMTFAFLATVLGLSSYAFLKKKR